MEYKLTLTERQEQGLLVEVKRRFALPVEGDITIVWAILRVVSFFAERGIQKIENDEAVERKRVEDEALAAREEKDKALIVKLAALPKEKRAAVEALIMKNGS